MGGQDCVSSPQLLPWPSFILGRHLGSEKADRNPANLAASQINTFVFEVTVLFTGASPSTDGGVCGQVCTLMNSPGCTYSSSSANLFDRNKFKIQWEKRKKRVVDRGSEFYNF